MVYYHGYGIVKQKLTLAALLVIAGLFAFLATIGVTMNASAVGGEVVYDALPSTVPQTSYPSQPFQAQQTSEFGDAIHLGGSARTLDSVTVTMVTWARYSEYESDPAYNLANWTHDITLTVYGTAVDANGEPTTVLAQKTQETTIPWRPEGDTTCPDGGYGAGFAWKDAGGTCRNGLAFNAVFDLSGLNATLPDDVIIGVAYDTQSYGSNPIGFNGPFNSLNIAVPPSQPVSVGNDVNVGSVFWNTSTASYYTNGGPGGYFREDTNWAPYGTVALRVEVKNNTPPSVPVNGLPNGTFKTTNEFDFTWDDSTDDQPGAITYEFQSSMNPAQVSGVLTTGLWQSGTLPDNMIHSSGAPDGTWYWQVRAKDSTGNYSAWSQIWSMTIDSVIPSVPTVLKMEDSSNVTIPHNGTTESYSVTTFWSTVPDVSYYEYSYWNDIVGNPYKESSRYIATPINGTSLSGVFNQGEGVHHVAVRAVDAAGNTSAWSTAYTVTYDDPTTLESKNECKNGGWKLSNLNFKNQGQCIKYFENKSHHDDDEDECKINNWKQFGKKYKNQRDCESDRHNTSRFLRDSDERKYKVTVR